METYLNGLKNQVTSVQLSNKIHDLGITTPSVFYREWQGAKEGEIQTWNSEGKPEHCPDNVNCYTVAELGEMLPAQLKIIGVLCEFQITQNWSKKGFYCHYTCINNSERVVTFEARTEADARAKMLIYLIENKLITL